MAQLRGRRYATPERVDWFNDRRLLELIGNIPPAEAEAYFYVALEAKDIAAQLTEISFRQTQHGSLSRMTAGKAWHNPVLKTVAKRLKERENPDLAQSFPKRSRV